MQEFFTKGFKSFICLIIQDIKNHNIGVRNHGFYLQSIFFYHTIYLGEFLYNTSFREINAGNERKRTPNFLRGKFGNPKKIFKNAKNGKKFISHKNTKTHKISPKFAEKFQKRKKRNKKYENANNAFGIYLPSPAEAGGGGG